MATVLDIVFESSLILWNIFYVYIFFEIAEFCTTKIKYYHIVTDVISQTIIMQFFFLF